jgi:hypothetical protein
MHGNGAGLKARPVVVAEDALHREALEQPVGDHATRAGAVLLGRLEQEMDRAAPALVARQHRGGAEQRDGVAVMPAGMHHIRLARLVGEIVGLLDRQGVHVRAQADGPVRGAALQGRDDAMPADAGDEGNAELGELLADEGAGRLFLLREFGMGVQVPSPGGQGFVQLFIQDGILDVTGSRADGARLVCSPSLIRSKTSVTPRRRMTCTGEMH